MIFDFRFLIVLNRINQKSKITQSKIKK